MLTEQERDTASLRIAVLAAADERALRRRLGNWACGHGVPSADFEDACQDAWCRLLATERRGRRTRNLEHALRWSVSNAWKDEARRRQRRPTVDLDSVAVSALLAGPDADPSKHLERLEAARTLFEAVNGLSDRQRQIVLLADVYERPPSQIWTRLEISERTYQREHALALSKIVEQLGDLLEDPSPPPSSPGPCRAEPAAVAA